MNYFKDTNNKVFAYDNEQIEQGLGKALTSITEEEKDAILLAKENEYKQTLEYKLTEAKAYLASTDFKMTSDYDQDSTEVKVKRQEAREFIRANEGDKI